jgi:hypothetical protein
MRNWSGLALVSALTLTLLLASCATMPDPVRADVRSIGVVSLLGDTIEVFHFGKFFDGYRYERRLDGAGIDETVERVVEARLHQSRPNVTVKRIRIEKDSIIRRSDGSILPMYDLDLGDIRAALRPWAAQNNVDIIVIVRQVDGPVPIQSPQSNSRGLGLYSSYSVVRPRTLALIAVTVWDGKTLDSVTQSSGYTAGRDTSAYTLDNKMEDNLKGSRRQHLVDELRNVASEMAVFLLGRVGL